MMTMITAVMTFLLDWFLKDQSDKKLRDGTVREVARDRIILRKLHNRGIALGGLKEHPQQIIPLMAAVLSGVCGSIIYYMRHGGGKLISIGYGLVLGGGLNNFVDRRIHGYVRDYFSFNVKWEKLRKLVFNVSDLAIFMGVILVTIGKLLHQSKK